MSSDPSIDRVLVQWGERVFYPGNRIVKRRTPHLSSYWKHDAAKIRLQRESLRVSGWRPHLEVGRLANDDGVHLTSEVDTYALQGRDAPAPWR